MRKCSYARNNINCLSVVVCIICAFTLVSGLFFDGDGSKLRGSGGHGAGAMYATDRKVTAQVGSLGISVCLSVKWDGNFSLIKNT